jgi:hypothetical protein
VREDKGEGLLRQDRLGLPDTAVVNVIELMVMPGVLPAGGENRFEDTK